ncbi:MAG: DUF4340 domain-containing protein [Eubacteriales bacterium]|nr:DUF4340 domain-containing protein [Eubacteriales bacterium]
MKKGKTLILLIVVMIAFVLIYFKMAQKNVASDEVEETATQEAVLQIKQADVTAVCFSLEGKPVTFKKVENTWVVDGDENFEVNQSELNSKLSTLLEMTSARTLENVESLDEYGLKQPMQTVEITLQDGTMETVYFGDINDSTANSYVYLESDPTKVYTVIYSVERAFEGELEAYRATTETEE